jgi:hypothetical protein
LSLGFSRSILAFLKIKCFKTKNQMIKQLKNLSAGVFIALAVAIVGTGCNTTEDIVQVAPVIASVIVNPTSVSAGGTAQITVTASDGNSDPLTYAYSANGGAVTGSGSSATWTAPTTAGSYQVTVTVTDGNGGTATGNGTLTVNAAGPTPTQVIGTATLPPGSSFDLSNSVVRLYLNDASGEQAWLNNTPLQVVAVTGSGASVSFILPNVSPQTYRLEIWKDTDGSGTFSTGDIEGHFGTNPAIQWNNLLPIIVTANQTSNVGVINMNLIL